MHSNEKYDHPLQFQQGDFSRGSINGFRTKRKTMQEKMTTITMPVDDQIGQMKYKTILWRSKTCIETHSRARTHAHTSHTYTHTHTRAGAKREKYKITTRSYSFEDILWGILNYIVVIGVFIRVVSIFYIKVWCGWIPMVFLVNWKRIFRCFVVLFEFSFVLILDLADRWFISIFIRITHRLLSCIVLSTASVAAALSNNFQFQCKLP